MRETEFRVKLCGSGGIVERHACHAVGNSDPGAEQYLGAVCSVCSHGSPGGEPSFLGEPPP